MASKSAIHQLKTFNDIEKILEVKIIGIRAEAPGGNMAATWRQKVRVCIM